jgi:hypothetical protein
MVIVLSSSAVAATTIILLQLQLQQNNYPILGFPKAEQRAHQFAPLRLLVCHDHEHTTPLMRIQTTNFYHTGDAI